MTATSGKPTPEPRPNPTAPRELPPRLREALRRGLADTGLRVEVCAYVDAGRRRGDPVERVIIDLKRELHAAGVIDRYAEPHERTLAESVIRWCIERYYGAAERGD
jgi:hypothetical protein